MANSQNLILVITIPVWLSQPVHVHPIPPAGWAQQELATPTDFDEGGVAGQVYNVSDTITVAIAKHG